MELLVLAVFALLACCQARAATLHVDAASLNPVSPYEFWTTAARTIQDAVDAAAYGDLVLVTNGVYDTGGRVAPEYTITNRVYVTPGVTVRSVNGPEVTSIVGSRSNFVRCVMLASNAQLIGFTLTNGRTRLSGYGNTQGGGVFCDSDSSIVSNCVITSCEAHDSGGGVSWGRVYNSIIENNVAKNGGGVAGFTMIWDSTIRSNTATQWGGGAYQYVSLYRCRVEGNLAGSGGGIALCQAAASIIANNVAQTNGGGVYYPGSPLTMIKDLNSCLIVGNHAGHTGGGVYNGGAYAQADMKLYNCTVVDNTAVQGGGGVHFSYLYNTIVWDNVASNSATHNADQVSAYASCAPELTHGVSLNITNNPLFRAAAAGDYRLRWASPCRDTGASTTFTLWDLDGNDRLWCAAVDRGAYEYPACAGAEPDSASYPYGGGTGSFSVVMAGGDVSWVAVSSNHWITFSGASSGYGAGTVSYEVTANSGAVRESWLLLNDVPAFRITQETRPTPPLFTSGPDVTNITASGATVRWTTDLESDSRVAWSRYPSSWEGVVTNETMTTEHEVVLTGLHPNTDYRVMAMSARESVVTVASDRFFRTRSLSPGFTLSSNLLIASGSLFPLAIQPETSGDVSYVDFFVDGQFIGRAFEPPFGIFFDPNRAFLGTNFPAGEHSISAIASDGFGVVQEVSMPWTFGADCAALDMTVDLWQPRYGTEFVVGPGVPNPPTNFTVLVNAQIVDGVIFEAVIFPGGMGPDVSEWIERDRIVKPERVELRVNGTLTQTLTNDLPGTPYYYEFDVGISGWSTGAYEVAVRAVSTNGCSMTRNTSISLVEAEVDLRMTRTAERSGHQMIASFVVSNASVRAVDLEQVMERSTGFQPHFLQGPFGSTSSWTYVPASSESRSYHTFPAPHRMNPGDTLVFHSALAPVLTMAGGRSYIGISTTFRISWSNEPARNIIKHEPVAFVRNATNGLTETFTDAWEQALRESDYLIVLNPEKMLSSFPASPAVNVLLEQCARLASIRGGVLAYYNARTAYSSRFNARDQSVLIPFDAAGGVGGGHLLSCGVSSASQIVAYAASGEFRQNGFPITGVELRAGDRFFAGNYMDSIGGSPHWRKELVLVRGDAWSTPGTATAFYFDGTNMASAPLTRVFGYTNACAAVMGNFVDGGHLLPFGAAEMLLLRPDNNLLMVNNEFAGGIRSLTVSFACGSLMAAGKVTGRMRDDLVVADPAGNRVQVYSFSYSDDVEIALAASIAQDVATDDRLLVANLDGSAADHIMLYDESERLLRLFRYDTATRRLVTAGTINDVRTLEDADALFAGSLQGGSINPGFILARGAAAHGDISGDISIYPYDGSRTLGSREILRDRITSGWRGQLATNWANEGTVLLVGENDLIPAFAADVGGGRIRETDRLYANVSGSASRPELAIGRIIGDTPAALSTHLTTILEQIDGTRRNQMRSMYLVSGHPAGTSGTSSSNNYPAQCDQMESIFTGKGIPVLRDQTDGAGAVALVDLFDKVSTNDIFLFAGHGNWNNWDITTSGNVDAGYRTPTNRAPLILAKTCVSGRYSPGFSHGEAFIKRGALAYIGATESIGTSVGLEFNKQMLRELDEDVTLGDVVKRTKRARSGINGRNDFTCDVYHLYGDPATLLRVPGRRSARRSAPRRASNEFEGAPAELTLHLPMYTVQTNANGRHEVFLDEQTSLTIEGMPAVPRYTAFLTIPAGKALQSVTMTDRSGLVARSNLPLEPWYYAEDRAAPRRSSIPTPPASGFWPEEDMHWSLDQAPGGASILILTVHPFFCNTNTADTLYYTNFTFALEYVDRQASINRVALDRPTYDTGDTVRIVGWLDAPDNPLDATVETIAQTARADYTNELPLQLLPGLRGLSSYAIEWDTASAPPGHYELHTILRDTSGNVQDRNLQYFSIGYADGELDDFALEPETFLPGEEVGIRCDFVNTGSDIADGTLVIEIRDAAGTLVDTLRAAISNLAVGATFHYEGIWTNHTLVPRNCQIVAYVNLDARTTPETLLSSWTNAPLFFQSVQSIQNGISMSWPSVAGRTYTLERSTNLLAGQSGFLPVEIGIPATPPMNMHSNTLEAPLQIFRVLETE